MCIQKLWNLKLLWKPTEVQQEAITQWNQSQAIGFRDLGKLGGLVTAKYTFKDDSENSAWIC